LKIAFDNLPSFSLSEAQTNEISLSRGSTFYSLAGKVAVTYFIDSSLTDCVVGSEIVPESGMLKSFGKDEGLARWLPVVLLKTKLSLS